MKLSYRESLAVVWDVFWRSYVLSALIFYSGVSLVLGLGYSARLGLIVVGMCAIVCWSVSTFWAIGTVVQKSYATSMLYVIRYMVVASHLKLLEMRRITWLLLFVDIFRKVFGVFWNHCYNFL